MANILLPPHVFNVGDFVYSPNPQDRFRKIIFQCDIRVIYPNGDIELGLIGYPAWKKGNAIRERWNIGKKAIGTKIKPADPSNPNETIPFNPADPLAVGNNECPVWQQHPVSEIPEQKQDKVEKQLSNIFSDEKKYEKITFSMNSKIYKENLHTSYDVTFSDGTTTSTNPCPPNQPGE